MSVAEGTQIPIEVTGGLVTNIDPESLPPGVSPDCADVAFKPGTPGTVQTRPGLAEVHAFTMGSNLTYFTTYTDLQGNQRTLYLDSLGALWQEFPQGTFAEILDPINGLQPGLFSKSDTAFGSEFMAFSDGKFGVSIPRRIVASIEQFTIDRLSQVGPGSGPTSIVDTGYQILSISRTSDLITVTINTPFATSGLAPGGLITISGVIGDATLNGSFPIATASGTTTTTVTAYGVPGMYQISSLVRAGGDVTAVLATSPAFTVGSLVIIYGSTVPSFDGQFTVASINGNEVTWVQAGPNASSFGGTLYTPAINVSVLLAAGLTATEGFVIVNGDVTGEISVGNQLTVSGNSTGFWNATWDVDGVTLLTSGAYAGDTEITFPTTGTASLGYGGMATVTLPNSSPAATGVAGPFGNISAGEHQVSVVFITRNGYFTAPAEPTAWVAEGGFEAIVSGIPLGPPNVIARLLIFTTAEGNNFFFSQANGFQISNFLIPDNMTQTLLVDFSDLALLSSTAADLLFNRIELPECAGLLQFADRIFAWGARNRVENFVNMSFDGGVESFGGYPLGWTVDAINGAGGSTENSTLFGFDYVITMGATGFAWGMIEQSAYQDYLGVAIMSPLKDFGIRVWLKSVAPLSPTGMFTVDIWSPSLGVISTATVSFAGVTEIFQEFIVPFNNEMPATIPTDALIRAYAAPGGVAGVLIVKNLEVYPLDEPYQTSVLFASNVADPEAFDGVTGFLEINENDGLRLTALGIIRDRLYITKNVGGLYVTSDDASSEPSGWTLDTISRRVGAESINSIGTHIGTTGEDWLFIMSREGVYIFWSSEPPKISQEIQPTWEAINFDYLYQGWVAVDTANRRLLVGVPMGTATSPNKILQMDYQMVGMDAESVAGGAPIHSNYAGALKAYAASRKWAPWNIAAGYGGLVERNDGNAHMFIGSGVSDGVVSELSETALADYSGDIPGGGYYFTAFYPDDEQQQNLQMHGNRVLQRYVIATVYGFGNLEMDAYGPGFVNEYVMPIATAPRLTLSAVASQDMESYCNFQAERVSNKFSVQSSGAPWWSLTKFNIWLSQDPVLTFRGYN